MNTDFYQHLSAALDEIKSSGMHKEERIIRSAQSADIELANGKRVINFCANNYLGLADNPELIAKAKETLDQFGFGMASVRFICGTQTIHRDLEKRISQFLHTEDTILYSSCFDANGGLFETLLTSEDAIISDQLNHASIIDGVRLCKAKRFRYNNNDMTDLRQKLELAEADGARFKLVATDGVFSMDGIIANLAEIRALCDEFNALMMVDDSHATGFVGENGRGSVEACGVLGNVDIITSTLGKALGGATGGFTSGKKEVIAMLRQRSRPYLFSNAIAPVVAATSITVLNMVEKSHALRQQLARNQQRFRTGMQQAGFDLIKGDHPIIPVMLYDEQTASTMAEKLLQLGIYVIAFSYPVVPKGVARIRTQMSAAHTDAQIDQAIEAFILVGKEMGVI